MKKLLIGACLFLAFTTDAALAQGKNSTPHALDCMAKAGFTRDMWVAKRAGTNAQVAQYIACRDGVSVTQAKKTGKKDGNFDTWTPGK
ncbi:hypothetical protein JQ596_21840 [Bradyrhizobium manausense]|uniref:hypothetical protein n=1 Tax=Bradyrhizobium TaxID=374 RepID=UPI001BA65EF3|nr:MULTISPECIES: hypothetical protein [Bradyrhizobium]MBR0828182.1 hypothetical protein [Bradyrhizobium manausense]UVO25225.1 hypothetical protein KUF59_21645 [Bradyrhizobium arachidis]